MRHDIDDTGPHERRQPDRRAGVIGKGQKGPAIRDQAAMHGDAVHRRRHAVLAHTVTDIVAGKVAAADVLLVLGLGVVRRGQIGRAADQLGNDLCQGIEDRAGGLARRDLGVRLAEVVAQFGDGGIETVRQLAALTPQELVPPLRREGLRAAPPRRFVRPRRGRPPRAILPGHPRGPQRAGSSSRAARAPRRSPPRRAVRHAPRRCRPWSAPQRRSSSGRRSGSGGRSVGPPDGVGDRLVIMPVDPLGGPAIRPEPQ